jgi:Ulp1 protease family, C-terminal catalytic domain
MITFLEKLLLDEDEDQELYQYYYGNKKRLNEKKSGKGKGLLVGGFYDIFYGNDVDDVDANEDLKDGGGKTVKVESPSYTNVNACAPGNIDEFKESGTCFTDKALKDIAGAINDTPDMKKIKIDGKTKKQLWNDIKEQMKGCNNEWCWLSQKFVKKVLKAQKRHTDNDVTGGAQTKDDIFLNTFKIPIPKGKHQWLTTDDIDFSIKQFIPLANNAAFLGAVPVDFTTFSHTKNKFTSEFIKKLLKKGVRNIAIVFNTDPHNKSGRHWIAGFIRIDQNGKKGKAYFYDSFGAKAPKQIKSWFDNFPIPLSYEYNKVQHQYENSECGVYSIHFIVRMLFGASFKSVTNNIIKDVEMNAKRKKYFNPYK